MYDSKRRVANTETVFDLVSLATLFECLLAKTISKTRHQMYVERKGKLHPGTNLSIVSIKDASHRPNSKCGQNPYYVCSGGECWQCSLGLSSNAVSKQQRLAILMLGIVLVVACGILLYHIIICACRKRKDRIMLYIREKFSTKKTGKEESCVQADAKVTSHRNEKLHHQYEQ